MNNWQEIVQSVFIGLIFAFLVAKLISTVILFREDNLRVVRQDESQESIESDDRLASMTPEESIKVEEKEREEVELEEENLMGKGDDNDDWERIESTELDETFSAATALVSATAADRTVAKVSNDVQLQLYGLYKIATEGPCAAPQPPAFRVTARAKWNAWQKLGGMPPEEAMEQYILIVNELFPTWANGSRTIRKDKDPAGSSSAAEGTMGPVFSSFVHEEEESNNDLKLDAIHVCAREGDISNLLKHIENGNSVNSRDSEGRTPLHWAVDRGHQRIVEILINKDVDVNAKDNEGQTPLHYAVVCEREAIAELLVKYNADCYAKDDDGNSPSDLCGLRWTFMPSSNL